MSVQRWLCPISFRMARENILELCREAFKEAFVPTTSKRLQEKKDAIKKKYKGKIEALEADRDRLKFLTLDARQRRIELLRKILPDPQKSVRNATLLTDAEDQLGEQQAESYLEHVRTAQLLSEHLKDVEHKLEEFKYAVDTQAVVEFTGCFRGFRDWGESMNAYLGPYATSLATLSLAGAALVYSTIFGASRGDINLMGFTFPLFTAGFMVSFFVLFGIHCASHFPKMMPFASQRFWTVVIIVFLLIATLMVIVAILIVNITIYNLKTPADSSSSDVRESNLGKISGIISLTFSGILMVIFVLAVVLSFCISGRKGGATFNRFNEISDREKGALDNYSHA